jgi:alpha-ketoglutarate-dependent taurine dioxygenase
MSGEQEGTVEEIKRASREEGLVLSFAQQRLWFMDQLVPDNPFYNVAAAVKLSGQLNVKALRRAFSRIEERHEVLRTVFRGEGEEVRQVILAAREVEMEEEDISEIEEGKREEVAREIASKEAAGPFSLSEGPMMRVKLIRLREEEHVVCVTMHHIVTDGWSMGVFVREMGELYEAYESGRKEELEELKIQYGDYAVWQREWLQGEVLEEQMRYWKKQLKGVKRVELVRDRERPKVASYRGAIESVKIGEEVSRGIREMSRGEGVTVFMTMLAGLNVLLHRYSGETDIVVGTDIANRTRGETEGLIGFFINHLVMRTEVGGDPTFRELLRREREVALGAYAHQDLPFEKLVEELQMERKANQTPIFQILFVLQNAAKESLQLPSLNIQPFIAGPIITKYDLTLLMDEYDDGFVASFAYNTSLFDSSYIKRLTKHFLTLLESIVKEPERRLSELEMETEAEKLERTEERVQRKSLKIERLKSIKRTATNLTKLAFVEKSYLDSSEGMPLVLNAAVRELDLSGWAAMNSEFIGSELLKHGAILFRGFKIDSVDEFKRFAQSICLNLFDEYGDLPQENLGGGIYRSTPYPPDKAILFHNESSHRHEWPMRIFFYCLKAAEKGGETPIVDSRRVYQALPTRIKAQFEKKQLMYVRNFTTGLDVSWQRFFRTTDRAVIGADCSKAGIEFEWVKEDGLRTRQVRPAVRRHPKSSDVVFFNQVLLHHSSCLDTATKESLLSLYGEEGLPRNCYYGDGSMIETSIIEEVLGIYRNLEVKFPWEEGDILVLDNMLAAHGRNLYIGHREIYVAMGEMMASR